jgi:hypothetical protein
MAVSGLFTRLLLFPDAAAAQRVFRTFTFSFLPF